MSSKTLQEMVRGAEKLATLTFGPVGPEAVGRVGAALITQALEQEEFTLFDALRGFGIRD